MFPEEYGSLFNVSKCTDIPLVPMWSIQAEGEECGGPWGIYGECGEGLECRQDHCPPGEQDLECYHHYLTGQPVPDLLTLLLTIPKFLPHTRQLSSLTLPSLHIGRSLTPVDYVVRERRDSHSWLSPGRSLSGNRWFPQSMGVTNGRDYFLYIERG